MKKVALFIIFVVALVVSSCSTSRKATATSTQAEAQLTATTEQQHHAEATEQAAIITNVTTDERRNVVIDFAKVEFYPGAAPSVPSDSTAANDIINAVFAAATEEGQKAKPPNVKSVTKGRAIINGEKNKQARTEAQAERNATEDTATAEVLKADSKEATDIKTEEKPKFTFWDWLYIFLVVAACSVGISFIIYVVRQIRKDN